ncbi:MAG: hypothetical protein PGN09_08860 [Sphingomonas fennica]
MRRSTRIAVVVAIVAAGLVAWHLSHRAPAGPATPGSRARTVAIGGTRTPPPQSLDQPTTGYVVLDRETGKPAGKQ